MIIVMESEATELQVQAVIGKLEENGLKVHLSTGDSRTIIGVIGDKRLIAEMPVEAMEGVEKTISVTESYKLVAREFHPEDTVINVNGVLIGGGNLAVMAGPCAVESREQLLESAQIVKNAGAQFLRGGAYKPRTSPYAFQGLEEKGLEMLAEAREITGLRIVTEVVDVESVPVVAAYADMLQIGARNMQNFSLLKEVGKTKIPVALKRGMSATIDDVLNAAEYIAAGGNNQIILIERGIRTFDNKYTRNTFDVGAVPVLQQLTHYPVIVDPSHAAGVWDLVTPLAQAGVAAGASGLIVEIHDDPEHAFSDGPQALKPDTFKEMARRCEEIHKVVSAWK